MPAVTRYSIKMSAENFQTEYSDLKAKALAYFPAEEDASAREKFITDARQELLCKYNLLSQNNDYSSGSGVNNRQRNTIKDFLATCPKYNSHNESIIDFYDRFENALKRENVSDDKNVQLLEALLPVNLFTPFERHLPVGEQYELYKQRSFRNSRCTHIDLIYKCCNSKFDVNDSYMKIYENIKNDITKTCDLVTGSRISAPQAELFTKMLMVCRLPRSIKNEISETVRPENLSEFQVHLERFATSRNRTVGSFFSDFKPKSALAQSEKLKNSIHKPTSENNSVKKVKTCNYCSKPGHSEDICYAKFPEKRPGKPSQEVGNKPNSKIRHAVIKNTFKATHGSGVNFMVKGSLNDIPNCSFLVDPGAKTAAFHENLCPKELYTDQISSIASLSCDYVTGNFPVVEMFVDTPILTAAVEGVAVPNLEFDAIIPIYKTGNNTAVLFDPVSEEVSLVNRNTSQADPSLQGRSHGSSTGVMPPPRGGCLHDVSPRTLGTTMSPTGGNDLRDSTTSSSGDNFYHSSTLSPSGGNQSRGAFTGHSSTGDIFLHDAAMRLADTTAPPSGGNHLQGSTALPSGGNPPIDAVPGPVSTEPPSGGNDQHDPTPSPSGDNHLRGPTVISSGSFHDSNASASLIASSVQTSSMVDPNEEGTSPGSITNPHPLVNIENIKFFQNTDVDISHVYDSLLQNDRKLLPKGYSKLKFEIIDNILYRINVKHNLKQIVVPKELIKSLLYDYHDQAGHPSHNYTLSNVLRSYFFVNASKIIANYIKNCDVCQRNTTSRHHKDVKLREFTLTKEPMEHICIDYVTHFEMSPNGHKYLFTIVDVATRFANCIPMKSLTVKELIPKFLNYHVYKYGFPKKITSDNGGQFISHLFSKFCQDNNIEHVRTVALHPQSNGINERFNGTITKLLRNACHPHINLWDEHIHDMLFSYNSTVRRGTNYSPYDLIMSYQVQNKLSRVNTHEFEEIPVDDYVSLSKLKGFQLRADANKNLIKVQNANRKGTDVTNSDRSFDIGDFVLMKEKDKAKMQFKWSGPYLVINKNDCNYTILINEKPFTYHANLLKKYFDDDLDEPVNVNYVFLTENIPCIPKVQNVVPIDDDHIKCRINDTLMKYSDTFSDKPSVTNIISHKIVLTDDIPVCKQNYPIPLAIKDLYKNEIKKMLDWGIIEPSKSNYSSPSIVVPKKNKDEIRFCIDFRALNQKMVKDKEPIPNMNSLFAKLSKTNYYSILDLTKGFWQIPLDEDSKKYTAFSTEEGLFHFRVMPFGLANGPSEFARLMRLALPYHPNVFNFLDDILIASESIDEHIDTLEFVFTHLNKANLKVNPKKSHFCVKSVEFLGHQLNSDHSSPLNSKLDAINEFPLPKTKKQLRSFLGLCNFYNNYVKNFAFLAQPMYSLLKKNSPKLIKWPDVAINAFDNLKSALSSNVKLFHVDPNKPYVLQCDASEYAISGCLGQILDDKFRPIQCISRKLNNAEQNYSVLEKEALAIVWAIQKLSLYLYGTRFIIQTDHKPLSFMNSSNNKGRLRRWALALQNYMFEIEHIPGAENIFADSLTRIL